MKDNTLIAEFMGLNIDRGVQSDYMEHELKYHTSWDWLMPVIHKIKVLVMEDNSDKLYNSEEWDNITHTLVQIEIKCVYEAVVEFINQYNKDERQ